MTRRGMVMRKNPRKQIISKSGLQQLFPYDKDDITTWPWIDCSVSGSTDNPKVTWIKNPDFKYGHLIADY